MRNRPESDKSTTDDDSTKSDLDTDSEATLSESDGVTPRKKFKWSTKRRIIKSIFIIGESTTEVDLANKLGISVSDSYDDADLIIYPTCEEDISDDRAVCRHWLIDSSDSGIFLPITLYNLCDLFDFNDYEDDQEDLPPVPHSKYACQRIHPLVSPNEGLVDDLRVLKYDRKARNEQWNYLAYSRAASTVKSLPHKISSKDDISLHDDESEANKYYKNIGSKKIASRIEEYINYGRIDEADRIRNSDVFKIQNVLETIQGIGPQRAYEMSRNGVKSVNELVKSGKITQDDATLAEHLQIGIDRQEVESIAKFVVEHARNILPHLKYTICGGYRRGKPYSNDIDIVVTHHGCNITQLGAFLVKLTEDLQNIGFLTQLMRGIALTNDKRVADSHDYQSTMFGVVASSKLFGTSDSDEVRLRRLDIIVSVPKSYQLEILGWTGSIMYERDIRSYVKQFKLKLNSSSIFNERTNNLMDLRGIRSERHLLRILELPWIRPEDRNCD